MPARALSADRGAPYHQVPYQISLLMSRLDDQQQRWYAAIEAMGMAALAG